jgi:hypothetical protein
VDAPLAGALLEVIDLEVSEVAVLLALGPDAAVVALGEGVVAVAAAGLVLVSRRVSSSVGSSTRQAPFGATTALPGESARTRPASSVSTSS